MLDCPRHAHSISSDEVEARPCGAELGMVPKGSREFYQVLDNFWEGGLDSGEFLAFYVQCGDVNNNFTLEELNCQKRRESYLQDNLSLYT
jgi:hypothetical protein